MTETKISIVRIILGATVFVIISQLLFLDIAGIDGSSMQPTLRPGQTVFVSRLSYGLQVPLVNRYLFFWHPVQEGDIVVFNSPLDNRTVVKRCIAAEGTPIEIRNETLFVGEEAFPLRTVSSDILAGCTSVPVKTILVIGDNRNHSVDSRFYGFVPVDRIRGRVLEPRRGQKA